MPTIQITINFERKWTIICTDREHGHRDIGPPTKPSKETNSHPYKLSSLKWKTFIEYCEHLLETKFGGKNSGDSINLCTWGQFTKRLGTDACAQFQTQIVAEPSNVCKPHVYRIYGTCVHASDGSVHLCVRICAQTSVCVAFLVNLSPNYYVNRLYIHLFPTN